MLSSTLWLHFATNRPTPHSKVSLCCDVHTKGDETNPPLIMQWSFLPDALVILGSGDVAESSGTDNAPWSGQRRMEDVPGGARERPRQCSQRREQIGDLLFFCSRFPSFYNKTRRHLRAAFVFFRNIMLLYINEQRCFCGLFFLFYSLLLN